jgi:hypothetical protein
MFKTFSGRAACVRAEIWVLSKRSKDSTSLIMDRQLKIRVAVAVALLAWAGALQVSWSCMLSSIHR